MCFSFFFFRGGGKHTNEAWSLAHSSKPNRHCWVMNAFWSDYRNMISAIYILFKFFFFSFSEILGKLRAISFRDIKGKISFVLMSTATLKVEYSPSSDYPCVVNVIGKGSSARLFVVFQLIMMVLFPRLAVVGLYVYMIVAVNSSAVASAVSKAKLLGKMTRMVAITSLISIICCTPSLIYLFLAFAGKTNLLTTEFFVLPLLTFLNISINPFFYGLSNENFRQSYKIVFDALYSRIAWWKSRKCNKIWRVRIEAANFWGMRTYFFLKFCRQFCGWWSVRQLPIS